MKNSSDNLKLLRQEQNLNQEELAKILCVKQNTISNIERDYRKPSYEVLISISDYFNVSLDWLVGRTDEREINK